MVVYSILSITVITCFILVDLVESMVATKSQKEANRGPPKGPGRRRKRRSASVPPRAHSPLSPERVFFDDHKSYQTLNNKVYTVCK